MKALSSIFLAILTVLLFAPGKAAAYQEIEVKNGGTIQGRATIKGETPHPRVYHLVLFPNVEMCSKVDTDDEMNRVLDDFIADDKNGLKDVIVSIEHVEAGKPFPDGMKKSIPIKSENCKFTPEANVIQQDGAFTVDNKDSVMHNSQVYQSERGKILLNIPIPAEEISNGTVRFQKDYKIFQMICGMHEFMQTWGFRVQNPYNSQTAENGVYKIDGIPPGDYVVTAWHYLMKMQSKKVHISDNSVVDLDFEFNADQVVRPLYETIRSGRIKKDAKGRLHSINKTSHEQ